MAKKNDKIKPTKFQIGDYVRVIDKDIVEDLDLDFDEDTVLHGVITGVFGAIFVKNSTYAEYLVQIQGYPQLETCLYPNQFEKV